MQIIAKYYLIFLLNIEWKEIKSSSIFLKPPQKILPDRVTSLKSAFCWSSELNAFNFCELHAPLPVSHIQITTRPRPSTNTTLYFFSKAEVVCTVYDCRKESTVYTVFRVPWDRHKPTTGYVCIVSLINYI